ncbi:MAG: transketolase C-terminal domain-containing protein [bacterium]|nr:transketolase C-terminal domain-containing protein [bacterium]
MIKKDIKKRSIRDGFGEALVEVGEKNKDVVVLTADLKESTRVHWFAEKFPDRFIEVGVAEQALVTIASGMAAVGKIPFATTYAVFSPGRTLDQIRTTVALNNQPVKIVGAHAGLGAGPYGATHQALEDIAVMRTLPNMIVEAPCDYEEAKKATLAVAKNGKPTYLRLERPETPVFTTEKSPFKVGRAETLRESKDPLVAIVACGSEVYEALLAAEALEKKGINVLVINSHTIKPIDEGTIIRAAKTCGAVVTVEEHQIAGGLGSAVSEVLSKNFPVPMEFIGINDCYGESGTYKELKKKFGLMQEDIVEAVKRVMVRKLE